MRTLSATLLVLAVAAVSAIAGRLLLPDLTGASAILPIPTPTPCETTFQTIVGRYYRDDHQQFLDFRGDGTVFMSVGGGAATYAVDRFSVVISTAIAGSARGSIPTSGGVNTLGCSYSGPIYTIIVFDKGGSTIQQALAGRWDKVGPDR